METLWQDVKYGVRMLRKNRGVTLITLATLALGIGATTAIFSVVYGVLLRPLGYPNPDQIVLVNQVDPRGGRSSFSDPNFEDVKAQNHSFQALAEFTDLTESVSGGAEPVRARGAAITNEFFDVMGVHPAMGRGFLAEEQRPGAPAAMVVSYGFWQRNLGANRAFSAVRLTLLNKSFIIVGVMPRGFSYPPGTELWIPRELLPRYPSRTAHGFSVIGRIKDGVPLDQARSDLSTIAKRLRQQYGDDTWMVDVAAVPLQEAMVGEVRTALLVLLGAVAFLLLVACANVANLLLAQAATRQKELAVRTALGAGRARLVRQFLTEALVLALAVCVLGVLAAVWGVDSLLALDPEKLPCAQEVRVSWPMISFSLALSMVTVMGIGLTTALRATRQDIQESLKQNQRTLTGGSNRLRSALVVAQLGVTAVLLVGAGLLGKSFLRLISVDPGYRMERTVVMDVALPSSYHDGPTAIARRGRFHEEMIARLRAIPSVTEAGGINSFPLAGGGAPNGTFLIVNKPVADFQEFGKLAKNPAITGSAEFRIANEGYFRAMHIPLVRGRLFDDRDAPDAQHAALISDSLAKQRWPNEDPLGKLIEFGNMDGDLRLFQIVGIVGDVREFGIDTKPRPTFYADFRQRPTATAFFTYVLSGQAPPAAIISSARSILHELAPDVPPRFHTMEQLFSASVADRRFNLVLLAFFSAAALVLATMGIYGVTSYVVAQRTQEIGIRIALGAQRADVLKLILGQSLRLVLAGVAMGLLGAAWLTRLITRLLFDVQATDSATFAACTALLGGVALVACYLPARRATKVDPMVALRYE